MAKEMKTKSEISSSSPSISLPFYQPNQPNQPQSNSRKRQRNNLSSWTSSTNQSDEFEVLKPTVSNLIQGFLNPAKASSTKNSDLAQSLINEEINGILSSLMYVPAMRFVALEKLAVALLQNSERISQFEIRKVFQCLSDLVVLNYSSWATSILKVFLLFLFFFFSIFLID